MDDSRVPRWTAPMRIRRDNDGVVLVYSRLTQTISFLNPAAAEILENVDGEHDIAGLAREMRERYPHIDPHVIERDVKSSINMFAKEGYIVLGVC